MSVEFCSSNSVSMSIVDTKLFSGLQNIMDLGDPRIKGYFLMDSPFPVVAILIFYVVFVFKLGPRLMANRKPMKLKKTIMIYDWIQIILNGYLVLLALKEMPYVNIFCTPLLEEVNTPRAKNLIFLQYSYTLLKIVDLLDTMFFVLRKKNNQITFLHVYHHLMMVIATWVVMKFYLGGQTVFIGLLNLFVHTVMYLYYFLTAWNPAYRTNLWWKKYITQLQLAQHFSVFTCFVLPLMNPSCSYPKGLSGFFVIQALIMIYLFMDFYLRAYTKNQVKTR